MINTLPFLFFHTRSFACQNEISVQKDCSMWSTASHIIARSKRCMKDENLRRNEMSFYVEEWRMMERSNKREGNGNCRMEEIFFYWFRCDETRRRRHFKDDRRNVRNFSSHACARKKNLINLEEGNNFMIKYQHLRHYILLVIFDWRSLLALLPLSKSMNPLSLRLYCHRDVIHTFDFHCSFKHAYRV